MLAADVISPIAVPGHDNSAMDGYALRWEETRGATRDHPVCLRVVGTCAAGALPSFSLAPGEAARIFTGAPLPAGADAVLRQEAARAEEGGEVAVFVAAREGEHVRRRGEELAEGEEAPEGEAAGGETPEGEAAAEPGSDSESAE